MSSLPIIEHQLNGITIEQRSTDGYLNATKLTKSYEAGTGTRKDVGHWLATDRAKAYVEYLSAKTGIPVLELVQVKKGGNAPGTWLHPKLATPFATWLSVEYEFQVGEWIEEWLVTGQNPLSAKTPSVDQSVYQRIVQNVASEAKESINKISHLTTHKHTHLHKLGQEQLTKTPATADEAQRLVAEILIEAFDSLNKVIGNAVSQHSRLYNLGKKEMAQLLGEAQSVRFELLHSAQLALPTTVVHITAKDRRKIISDFLDQVEIMTEQERQDLLFALPNLGVKERRHGRWSCRLVARHLGLSETQHRTVGNIMRERNWSL